MISKVMTVIERSDSWVRRLYTALTFSFFLLFLQANNAYSFDILAELQDSAPKSYMENNEVQGICVDILKELDERLAPEGVRVVLPPGFTPTKRIMLRIRQGITHIYCGAGRNAEREELFNYSPTPLYNVRNIIVADAKEAYLPKDFKDLAETRSFVGARYGSSSTRYLKKQPDVMVLDTFNSINEGMLALDKGRIRYFFYHDLGLLYTIKQNGWNLKVVPTTFREYQHWMISSKTLPTDVTAKLHAAITAIYKDGTIEAIKDKYRP